MTEEQLKIWFWDKFNSCFLVKHDNIPHWINVIYNYNYGRYKKLGNILNKEILKPSEYDGEYSFVINTKNNYVYIYHSCFITKYLNKNNNTGISNVELITKWFSENEKTKLLKCSQSTSILTD